MNYFHYLVNRHQGVQGIDFCPIELPAIDIRRLVMFAFLLLLAAVNLE